MSVTLRTATPLLFALSTACSGKDGGEVPVTQTPVVSGADSADTASGDTADTGDTGETDAETTPEGPFWMTLALTGGDPASPQEGQPHVLQTGAAQLTEDPTGFVLSLRFEGVSEGTAIVAPCVIPFSFTGGLPIENAETGGGGYDVGCPKLTLDGTLFAENLNGLTTVTVNDGGAAGAGNGSGLVALQDLTQAPHQNFFLEPLFFLCVEAAT